jgi:PhzF family phenazine biosynthesis protein
MSRPFALVDVFGDGPLSGNPLAVVRDADGMSTEAMQALTRWFNLSETTFVLPPESEGADYRVRIFTPHRELPFAGHPTLGTCHAFLEGGGRPRDPARIMQECGVGLVAVRNDGGALSFAAPPLIRSGAVDEATLGEVLEVLRLARDDVVEARWIDNGPGWIGLLLHSAEAVLALEPARASDRRIDAGVVGPHEPGAPAAFEVRAFFSDHLGALREDPVTGSLNASVAQWLFATGRASGRYVAAQGTRLGCRGRVVLTEDSEGVWVGGNTVTIARGSAA